MVAVVVLLAGCPASEADPAASRKGEATPSRQMAVTFDDLPAVAMAGDDCDAAALRRLTDRLLAQVAERRMPVAGLVTASRVCEPLREGLLPELLERWLDAGAELGNHTFSHPDLNRTPVADYLRDVERGEVPLARLLAARGQRLSYFRHPLLHAGDTAAKKRAVAEFLADRGYTVAPVTIDNQEWVFAAVYARAVGRGDPATAERVRAAYVPYMEEVVAFFERRAVEVLGYEPPQVLLLHANELNADAFGELAAMLERRGYAFVTLEGALADPAYRREDPYVGPRGLSWIHRWGQGLGIETVEEPREPRWLAELFAGG